MVPSLPVRLLRVASSVETATLKISDSPYIGRFAPLSKALLLPMGPLMVEGALGRPMLIAVFPRGPDMFVVLYFVPLCLQPVHG